MSAMRLYSRWFFRVGVLLALVGLGGWFMVALAQAAPPPKATPPAARARGSRVACEYRIGVQPGPGGVITPGTGFFACGSTVVFTILPNPNYFISDVGVNGFSQGAVNSYTFTNLSADHLITAQFAITSYHIFPIPGPGGSIFPDTPQAVNHGDSVTFTIVPNPGYHVVDVGKNGISLGALNSYVFTNVTAAHTLSAVFAINIYTLTASAGDGGSMSPAGALTFTHGQSQTYLIQADANYRIAAVRDNGIAQAVAGDSSAYTHTLEDIAASHLITAAFAPLTHSVYAAAYPLGGGAIIPNGIQYMPHGSSLAFTLTPNSCYSLMGLWVDSFPVISYTNPYIFSNITQQHSISATFTPRDARLVPMGTTGGTISPSEAITVVYGVPTPITFTAAPGYHLSQISVNGRLHPPASVYTLNGVCDLQIVSGTFSINTYNITATTGPNGTIAPSGVNTVAHGSSAVFTITPGLGHYVEKLWIDGVPQAADPLGSVYTFANVTATHTLSATFVSRLLRVTVVNSTPSVYGRVIVSGTFCLTTCSNTYPSNLTVPLTVGPSNGRFLGWGGNCNGTALTCPVQITATHSVTAYFGLRRFYLPFVHQMFWACLASLPDTDPNNTLEEAQGPLCAGRLYQAWPDDEYDWWYFDVPITGSITVTLANHTASGPSLQLRNAISGTLGYVAGIPNLQITCANFVSPNCTPGTPFSPGRYYIVVYTAGNYNDTPYHLTVTYPAPPAP